MGYRLAIYNVDRDPVRVLVNGREVGRLACTDPPLLLQTSLFNGLPWTIRIEDDASSDVIGDEMRVDGTWSNQALLVRAVGVIPVPPTSPVSAAFSSTRPDCPGVHADALPGFTAAPSDIPAN
jgi:hypothetical protein